MWTQLRLIGRLAVGTAFVISVVGATDAIGQAPAGEAAKPAAQTSQRPPATNPVKDGWITFKIHSAYVPEQALEGSDITGFARSDRVPSRVDRPEVSDRCIGAVVKMAPRADGPFTDQAARRDRGLVCAGRNHGLERDAVHVRALGCDYIRVLRLRHARGSERPLLAFTRVLQLITLPVPHRRQREVSHDVGSVLRYREVRVE